MVNQTFRFYTVSRLSQLLRNATKCNVSWFAKPFVSMSQRHARTATLLHQASVYCLGAATYNLFWVIDCRLLHKFWSQCYQNTSNNDIWLWQKTGGIVKCESESCSTWWPRQYHCMPCANYGSPLCPIVLPARKAYKASLGHIQRPTALTEYRTAPLKYQADFSALTALNKT